MRLHPAIGFSTLTLFGVVFWAIATNNTEEDSESGWFSNSQTNPEPEMSDRDNAAEEVRAVATKISNIEQAIENQQLISQAERQKLQSEFESNFENILAAVERSVEKDSITQMTDSLDGLQSRVRALEIQRDISPVDSNIESFEETGLQWVSSIDNDFSALPLESSQVAFPVSDNVQFERDPRSEPVDRTKHKPHLTIPATTTLLNATALTALVGRIPVRGQLQDPWRFKVILSADNLASNGHRIPLLAGMLVAGTARGDLSLSCVSGNIDTATFIFSDGTIQTTRKEANPESSFTGLGWISDEFGNPCIAGELKSNALQYLTQATLINTTRAVAEGISNAQTETTNSPGNGQSTTSVVGDIDKFVAGYATKESLSTVAQWLNDRQLNSFDAIYVPAGQSLAIHIEESIPIDHDSASRKVQNYLTGTTNASADLGWID